MVLSALALPHSAAAQELRGELLDTDTRRPVAMALVALLDTTMTVVHEVVTDEAGGFTLRAPRAGAYVVVAERIGYRRAVDGILRLDAGETREVEFFIRPEPLELGSLLVTARRDRTEFILESVGFFDRMRLGHGHFITPSRLAEQRAFNTRDLLRSIPRVTVQDNGLRGVSVFFRGGASGQCTPQGWVDGVMVTTTPTAPGFVLEEVVSIEDIEAMELYPGAASVPQRFGGINAGCGAIIIWTRHAERGNRDS